MSKYYPSLARVIDNHGLDFQVFNNSLLEYLLSLSVFIVSYLLLAFIKRVIISKISKLAEFSKTEIIFKPILSITKKTTKIFLFLLSAKISLGFLLITDKLNLSFSYLFSSVVFFQIGLWLDTAANLFIGSWIDRGTTLSPASNVSNLLKFLSRALIWIFVILLFLDNLGVDVTALVAGLGIGGIAVALAVQNILGDLLCSLSIALDEPFQIGDFIVIGNIKGTVEKIGIKSTRIRSLSGELIIISNSDLVKGQIQNFKKMQERRIVFNIGVTYQTSSEKLSQIPGYIKEIIEGQKLTRFDRSHFLNFGDSALIFETVYFVLSSEFLDYVNLQQKINLGIFNKFELENIDFAYPTQTIYLTSDK